jgi:UDP-GlcNAc:undecaprenyl-phosphate/decaprenyl-phosphate GlcNAc-1-phosphate transferase
MMGILLLSVSLTLVLGYPALLLAKRMKLIDIPGIAPHKVHPHPTPLAGGIVVVGILTITGILFRQWISNEILGVGLGILVIFVFGLWDDRWGLSASKKLIGQVIASIVLIRFGVRVNFMVAFSDMGLFSPELAHTLNIFITLLWLVGITNALNLIDSMDGIVAGLGVITFTFLWLATTKSGQPVLAFWSAVLLGVSIGLFYWNRIAGKFFLGDSGAQTIGFLLASLSMLYSPFFRNPESSWITPIMLLGVPILDTALVVFSRLRRKQAVMRGRLDHTYHRLIALGMSPQVAVGMVLLTAFLLGILAFLSLYIPPTLALIFFALFVIWGFITLFWLERQPTLDNSNDTLQDE